MIAINILCFLFRGKTGYSFVFSKGKRIKGKLAIFFSILFSAAIKETSYLFEFSEGSIA